MSDAKLRVPGNDRVWLQTIWPKGQQQQQQQHQYEQSENLDEEEDEECYEGQETWHLAPHSSHNFETKTTDATKRNARVLHNLVDDISKEQEQDDKDKTRHRVEQVRKKPKTPL